ncbi:hypothetical protein EV126DRAFT_39695 [Verticillium dahliae]|nr:hypothetical protein EV126DRAFT_39695 [Verticillium dahliae]
MSAPTWYKHGMSKTWLLVILSPPFALVDLALEMVDHARFEVGQRWVMPGGSVRMVVSFLLACDLHRRNVDFPSNTAVVCGRSQAVVEEYGISNVRLGVALPGGGSAEVPLLYTRHSIWHSYFTLHIAQHSYTPTCRAYCTLHHV